MGKVSANVLGWRSKDASYYSRTKFPWIADKLARHFDDIADDDNYAQPCQYGGCLQYSLPKRAMAGADAAISDAKTGVFVELGGYDQRKQDAAYQWKLVRQYASLDIESCLLKHVWKKGQSTEGAIKKFQAAVLSSSREPGCEDVEVPAHPNRLTYY